MIDKHQVGRKRRASLASLFRSVGAPSEADELAHHLIDLAEACEQVASAVTQLSDLPSTAETLDRRTFAELEGQLYEHMLPHMNALRPLLDRVTARLYEGAGEE